MEHVVDRLLGTKADGEPNIDLQAIINAGFKDYCHPKKKHFPIWAYPPKDTLQMELNHMFICPGPSIPLAGTS